MARLTWRSPPHEKRESISKGTIQIGGGGSWRGRKRARLERGARAVIINYFEVSNQSC